jgi:hypothetical protein
MVPLILKLEVPDQLHSLAAVPLEKSSDTDCTGGWVGTVACLDVSWKINHLPLLGFKPQILEQCAYYQGLSTSCAILTISKCDVSSGGSIRIGTGLINKVCTYFSL